MNRIRANQVAGIAVALCLVSGCATSGGDQLPATTSDGLTRVDSKKVDAVYWAEGATLTGYDSVMLLDVPVSFRKNWQRDYNQAQIGLGERVDEKDMERIRNGLSEEFRAEFTRTLEDGGYNVVNAAGANVLLLRPAIVDLDVNAPDLRSANMVRTYTADAGEMTLYMELYDSATGDKIGEVADRQRAMDSGRFEYTNSVTNKAEARRILRKWAKLLVDALDEANGKG